jgi:hypothetical protein
MERMRALVKADGRFELGYGSLLTIGAVVDWLNGGAIPVSRGVTIAAGISFLAAGASQLLYFVRVRRRRVMIELAVGNIAMATAGLVWLLADHGFSTAGGLILAGGGTWKAVIGELQLQSLRRGRQVAAPRRDAIGID